MHTSEYLPRSSSRHLVTFHATNRNRVQVLIEEELGQNPESGEGWTEYNFQAARERVGLWKWLRAVL